MKKLGFGMMRLPLLKEDDPTSVNILEVNKMVDYFIANGFTYFDTAYMYHNHESERIVKKCLVERYDCNSYTLASKLPTMFLTSKEDNEKFFNEQLEKCGVSYFDYYLLHNLNVNNYEKAEKFDSFNFCLKMKEKGLIKHLGFSFHGKAFELRKILEKHHQDIEFVQLQINYIDWDSENVESRLCYETVREYNKKIIVMEPVKGGTLVNIPKKASDVFLNYDSKMSIPSWAIRYAASLDGVMVVLSGMSNFKQMEDNVSYMKDFKSLTSFENKIVLDCAKLINEAITIPCTACNYCTEKCPKHINIPLYFSLYNKAKYNLNKNYNKEKEEYQKQILEFGKASSCIKCRQCERMCPQHLDITSYLEEVASIFEN